MSRRFLSLFKVFEALQTRNGDRIECEFERKIKTDFIFFCFFSFFLSAFLLESTQFCAIDCHFTLTLFIGVWLGCCCRGIIGMVLTGFSIVWCALSASKLFVTSLSMDRQQILVAYPAALFYGVFALITIF